MEPQARENTAPKNPFQDPMRDLLQRPPGNVVRDAQPNIYLKEFLDFQRPAILPDGRGSEYKSWLTANTGDIYKSVHQKEAATPEATADSYLDNATTSLRKALLDGKLTYTTDGAPPKSVEFDDKYKVTAATTARKLAEQVLGANASEEQLKKYAEVLAEINKIDATDKEIAAETKLKLPGQGVDGGISYRSHGKTFTQWHDGSTVEQSERGQGEASFRDRAAGCDVTISWDPEDKSNCKVSKTYEERRIETDATGVRTESLPPDWGLKSKTYEDDKGRRVSMQFDPKDSKLQRVNIQDWKSGEVIELEADAKGQLRGKKTDRQGDVLATMVAEVASDKLNLYQEQKRGDVLTKTYENGIVEEFKGDKLTRRSGKDDWGRQIEERLKPAGRMPPHQIEVTLNDAEKTKLTFSRTDFGEYWGETHKNGKIDQRYQIRPSGQIMFFKGQKVTSDLKDGTHIERSQVYDPKDPKKVAGYKVSQSKDGATYTVVTDRDGNIQSDKYRYGGLDGREIERTRSTNGKLFTGMTMTEASGHKTELKFDSVSGMFTGQRRNSEGKPVEDVMITDNKVIYTNANGNRRIELFDLKSGSLLGKKPKSGTYDIQKGTESFPNDDESVSVKPVADGRTDKVVDDLCFGRTVQGSTVRGERSIVTPDKTVVHNPDGTGVRLNQDMTIDRWGPEESDNAIKEPLSESEKDYLKYLKDKGQENEVDMRDIIELHRQAALKPDGEATLKKFYASLKTLDTAKNLSDEEKIALRGNLIHDVAHPEEMDQSRSPTCNTETVRRELAMNIPDAYVMQFYNAMNDGQVPIYTKAVDGAYGSNPNKPDSFVKVDPTNLKLADATGRNLAARIFDNMSVHISGQPDFNWVATEDGVGKFVPTDPEGEPKEFAGMQMGDIADVLTKLTGVNRGVVQLTDIDHLSSAFEANGGKSMIVAVNASKTPFSYERIFWDFDELSTNHVVSLTKIFDDGGQKRVNFMNQWGLENDHSTANSSVPIEAFLNNMTGLNTSWRGARPMTPPQVISAGDPMKVHKIVDGKVVVDTKYVLKNGRVQEK